MSKKGSVRRLVRLGCGLAALAMFANDAIACTGLTLRAKDGSVVYGRTMEWGAFDLASRLAVIPRGHAYTGTTPDGKPGRAWSARFGAVALDGLGRDIALDGMNEAGLTVGLFYHPGFAVYPAYDPARAAETLSPVELGSFLLTTCGTVEEARSALAGVLVAGAVEPAIGIVPPVHFLVTEPSGKAVVIEFLKGVPVVRDAPLGVITNAPSYEWHETNLRNYVNLSPVSLPDRRIDDLDFRPLGAGSGMIGLPGDFTPPSRFVRAAAFAATARPTPTGEEAVYELFRILDNFNVPLAPAFQDPAGKPGGLRSATLWTTAHDTKARVLYYHTQHNRRVRRVELGRIDFGRGGGIRAIPLDREKRQDYEDVAPAGPLPAVTRRQGT